MDHLRKALNELMGTDRNMSLAEKWKHKEHFDDPDVCKYYLMGFCPHDLFPNTKADLGPCPKRHDEAFKRMYEKCPDRDKFRMKYERQSRGKITSACRKFNF